MYSKDVLRGYFRGQREGLSSGRKKKASYALYHKCENLLKQASFVLSFSSVKGEVDLKLLNEHLAKEGKLLMPRVEEDTLGIYHVTNLMTDLALSSWGILEPMPSRCKKANIATIDHILVPGLAFDQRGHRLGFGKGFYDRLLAKSSATSIGIGFLEQASREDLPTEPHDKCVDMLWLL